MMVGIIIPLIFIILGLILRTGKGDWLIAGYNTLSEKEKNEYDKLALCKFTGNLMIFFAIMLLLLFFCTDYLSPLYRHAAIIIFIALILIVVFGSLIYANTGNRFKKK